MCFLLLSVLADTLLQNEVFSFPFFLQLAKCKTSSLYLAPEKTFPCFLLKFLHVVVSSFYDILEKSLLL